MISIAYGGRGGIPISERSLCAAGISSTSICSGYGSGYGHIWHPLFKPDVPYRGGNLGLLSSTDGSEVEATGRGLDARKPPACASNRSGPGDWCPATAARCTACFAASRVQPARGTGRASCAGAELRIMIAVPWLGQSPFNSAQSVKRDAYS